MSSRTELSPSPSPPGRGRLLLAGAVFLAALAIRLLHLWQVREAPFFDLYMGDAADFHVWAREMAAGDWMGDEVFYHAPLYPYFLGVVYAVLGSHPLLVRAFQAVIGALACAILADAGHRLFSRRAGILAGGLLAVYAPAIFFTGILQDSALDILFASVFLWALVELVRGGADRPLLWILAGAALGAFALTRENALVLAAPVLLWAALQHELPRLRRAVLGVAFVGGMAILLLPVAARNHAVGGEFHLTTFNLGANLYIGNNPDADGYYRPLRPGRGNPAFELQDAVELAELDTGRELTPREVSDYWTRRALDYVVSQPLDWLALMGRKLFLVWNRSEVADTEDQYTYAEWSAPLRLAGLLFHFGILGALAVLGVWVTWGERRRLWLFYLMPALFLASVVVFFVFARYRFPVVPFLVLLAAGGLDQLPGYLRTAGRARLVGLALAVLAAAFVANRPAAAAEEFRAHARTNVGAALESQGRVEEALRTYREALAIDPRSSQGHFFLATLLQRQGQLEEALAHYETAATLEPENARIHNNYGVALALAGALEEAAEQLGRALEADPAYADALTNLGLVRWLQDRRDEAVEAYREALAIDPDHATARLRLGSALVIMGEVEEAFAHYGRAAEHVSVEETMKGVYGIAWELVTDPGRAGENGERALELARRAAELAPPDASGLRTLAAAYAANARYGEAVEAAEEALRRAGPDEELAASIREELARYREGRPLGRSAP